MDSPEELKIVEDMGLEIVGFLQLLRIQMAKFSGYPEPLKNGQILKSIQFRFPVYYHGNETNTFFSEFRKYN